MKDNTSQKKRATRKTPKRRLQLVFSKFIDQNMGNAPMSIRVCGARKKHPKRAKWETRYALLEIDDLFPPEEYSPNSVAPGEMTPLEQCYVCYPEKYQLLEKIAANPDPNHLLSLEPTGVDGPPVIFSLNFIARGNLRATGLALAYERGQAETYRAALRDAAPGFGVSRKAVDCAKKPILVRIVKNLS